MRSYIGFPKTVDKAVNKLLLDFPPRFKARIANMAENELVDLHFSMGAFIRNKLGIWSEDSELLKSCRIIFGKKDLHMDDASVLIMKEVWKKLKETSRLRVVK